MAFKIRDLMINIAPQGEEETPRCVGKQTHFFRCRGKHTDLNCTGKQTHPGVAPCTGKKTHMAGFGPDPEGEEDLEELKALKAELEEALAEVDAEIEECEETLRPKTVEEVTDLQSKLKDALEELDKIKEGLGKS